MSPLRVLFFDVETAPLLAYVWGQNADWIPHGQIIHDSFLLSWAAKLEGRKRVISDVLGKLEAVAQDDSRIVKSLAQALRDQEVVIAHNSDKFDIPVLNTRLLRLSLEPLGPVKTIDTLALARRSFRLASNRLDYLARMLGVPGVGKMSTDFDLWKRCYQGDSAALKYMVKYNKHDVQILEQVYECLRPYVKGLPRLVDAARDGEAVCPFCGAREMHRRGYHRTNASTFQRWQCQACSRWSRSRKADPEKRVSTVPL